MQASNERVTAKMIKERALDISAELGIVSFPGSNGWLDNFRRRYGLGKNNEMSIELQNSLATGDIKLTSSTPESGPRPKRPRLARIREEDVVVRDESIAFVVEDNDIVYEDDQEVHVKESGNGIKDADEYEGDEEQAEAEDRQGISSCSLEEAQEAHHILLSFFSANSITEDVQQALQKISDAISLKIEEALADGTVIEEVDIGNDDVAQYEEEVDPGYEID